MKTRIGILGYGNLGKGVECAVKEANDMELVAVFTRRDPKNVTILTENVPVCHIDEAADWKDKIDVMILCGGSATVDKAAKEAGKVAVISVGWDPGMFSLNRVYANAILPDGKDYTFWGKGVSQGHSDAIRRIKGVKNAKQYTIPVESAFERVRSRENPELTTREKHERQCFVVLEEGADAATVEKEIKEMPNYFSDYNTTVHFITEEELEKNHSGMAHGGFVIRSGRTGMNKEHNHIIEYSLKLDSNPEFTTSVLIAYARAAKRLYDEGQKGCKTVLDIAPAYLTEMSDEDLRAHLL